MYAHDGGVWRAVCDCGCGCEATAPTYNRILGAWRKVCREYEEDQANAKVDG